MHLTAHAAAPPELVAPQDSRWIAAVLWLIGLAVFLAGETLFVLNETRGNGAAFPEGWFLQITSLANMTIGALVLARSPGHRVGWLLYAIGLLLAVSYVLDDYAVYTLRTDPGALPFGRAAASLEAIGSVAFGLMAGYLALLFPHGDLPSCRWRPVLYVAATAIACLGFGALLRAGDLGSPFDDVVNPFGVEALGDVPGAVSVVAMAVLVAVALANLYALFSRFRRVDGLEQKQLEWFALGIAIFAATVLLAIASRLAGVGSDILSSVLFTIGFTAIPVTVGIAILRYRLYGIDWLINRTLVYVPLTAILAGVFVAVTGLVRTVFTEVTQQASDAAIAFSTILVVGALTPVKNALQSFVDSRFKEPEDPFKAVARLDTQARTVIEVMHEEAFLRRYLRELHTAFGAAGGVIRAGSSWYMEGDWVDEDGLRVDFELPGGQEAYIALSERSEPYTQEEVLRLQQLSGVIRDLLVVQHRFRAGLDRDGEESYEGGVDATGNHAGSTIQ